LAPHSLSAPHSVSANAVRTFPISYDPCANNFARGASLAQTHSYASACHPLGTHALPHRGRASCGRCFLRRRAAARAKSALRMTATGSGAASRRRPRLEGARGQPRHRARVFPRREAPELDHCCLYEKRPPLITLHGLGVNAASSGVCCFVGASFLYIVQALLCPTEHSRQRGTATWCFTLRPAPAPSGQVTPPTCARCPDSRGRGELPEGWGLQQEGRRGCTGPRAARPGGCKPSRAAPRAGAPVRGVTRGAAGVPPCCPCPGKCGRGPAGSPSSWPSFLGVGAGFGLWGAGGVGHGAGGQVGPWVRGTIMAM
jgi:hypothetical protein